MDTTKGKANEGALQKLRRGASLGTMALLIGATGTGPVSCRSKDPVVNMSKRQTVLRQDDYLKITQTITTTKDGIVKFKKEVKPTLNDTRFKGLISTDGYLGGIIITIGNQKNNNHDCGYTVSIYPAGVGDFDIDKRGMTELNKLISEEVDTCHKHFKDNVQNNEK